jgi:hypothetical protein
MESEFDGLGGVFGFGGAVLHQRPKKRSPLPRSSASLEQRRRARPQSAGPTRPQSAGPTRPAQPDTAKYVGGGAAPASVLRGARPSSAGPRLGGSAAGRVVAAVPSATQAGEDEEAESADTAPSSPQWVVERSVSFSEQGPEVSLVSPAVADLSVDMRQGLQLQSRSAPVLAASAAHEATLREQSRAGARVRGRGGRFRCVETVALLAGPSMQSARVGTLQKGEVVTTSEVRGNQLFVKHRGWCCRRLADRVLMVQLGGGVVPASVPAARRQQEVVRQHSEKHWVRSMHGAEDHSSPDLQTVVRRSRPSSAPAAGSRQRCSRAAGADATAPAAARPGSTAVNGRSLAGAYPAMGGTTVPETGASRPRPSSAGGARRKHDVHTQPAETGANTATGGEKQVPGEQSAAAAASGGIGAGGLPWQEEQQQQQRRQQLAPGPEAEDQNVDPRLHRAETTVTFHENSRPGAGDDVATAWQSLSMPDASVQKWRASVGPDARADAANAADAASGPDSFMVVRGVDRIPRTGQRQDSARGSMQGKVYAGDGGPGGAAARPSRPSSAPAARRDSRAARPSSAPASRGGDRGRNPNSVGGAGGGDRASLRRPASASERARERRLQLEAAVAMMDEGPVISIPSATRPQQSSPDDGDDDEGDQGDASAMDDGDGDSWGPLIDPRVNLDGGKNAAAVAVPEPTLQALSLVAPSSSDAAGASASKEEATAATAAGPEGDPDSVEFTAALIEWGRACDAGAEPAGAIPPEERTRLMAQAEAEIMIGKALHEVVVEEQTELMSRLVDEAARGTAAAGAGAAAGAEAAPAGQAGKEA